MPVRDYEFRYRLFVSVDLAGSTAFKQATPRWVQVFDAFFEDFPSSLRTQHTKVPDQTRGLPASPMEVWKYVGDEILFKAILNRHEEAAVHMSSMLNAMSDYERVLREKKVGLSLKATAWTAGFPVNNSEVYLRQPDADDSQIRDYLGPSIDLGFRLTKYADSRRIPVNLELAFLLAKAFGNVHEEYRPYLYYEQSESLKGVIGGTPYPLLWLDRRRGETTSEDALLGIDRGRFNSDAITKFCRDSFESLTGPVVSQPFIVNDPDEDIQRIPPEFKQAQEPFLREDSDRAYGDAERPPAGQAAEDDGKVPELPKEPPSGGSASP